MKIRAKSISMLIAAAVAISCLAAPVSANAASLGSGVVKVTEVSVSKESVEHSSVQSIEKEAVLDQNGLTADDAVASQLGFSASEYTEEISAPEQEETEVPAPETAGSDLLISNPISGTQSKVVVTKTVVEVPITDIMNLSTTALTLDKGEKQTITATVVDKYKNNGLVWTTSNSKVATVSGGTVTATGKGSCYVTATIKGTNIALSAKVTVNDFVLMQVKTTAYCGCKKCNGKWYGSPTATGTDYVVGRTIAVDRNVIKLGSKVEIDGHVYIAEDTGVKGKHIDIYFDSHSSALKYGVKTKIVKVYI